MDEGKVEKIVRQAIIKLAFNSESREKAESEIAFLDKHKEMMQHADLRKREFLIGSGVMEAGCKQLSDCGCNNQAWSGRYIALTQ